MLDELKDEELIRELKRAELAEHLTGDEAGAQRVFAILVGRHNRAFARLVTLRYGVDSASADEIAQDFWLECYSALPRYNPDRPFLAWATTILFRTAEKFLRKRSREVQLSPQSDFFDMQAGNDNPENEAMTRERMTAMLSALRHLPQDLALLIQLRFFENKKIEEITAATGLARSTIFDKLNLAYRKMRKLMNED
ncbi:MAG: RNA polymerase sigma factor [Spirochaetota bacterium]